jgi:hypothetical protein
MRRAARAIRWLQAPTLIVGLVLSACGTGGGVVERLDPQSTLMVVTDAELLVFARTDSRYSRSARDYVYLGPVEVNERGTRQYYLWIALSSMIDRAFLDADLALPDTLYIELAGAPVEFELRPPEKILPTLAGLAFYDPAVTPGAVRIARITVDQLRLLSQRELQSIRLGTIDEPSREYLLWERGVPWPTFSRYLAD